MFCYIHIPFCTSKCNYCRFASFSNFDALKVSFYVDFLCQSIQDRSLKTGLVRPFLQSVYFGGGTPSILTIPQLEQIFTSLHEVYDFSDDIEITFETTPQNISHTNLQAWSQLGINRVSLGVQSLNDTVLQEIGRTDSKRIFETLDILSTSPIQNISLDFIIGLPYTKRGELKQNITTILEKYTFPKHISVYMLEDYMYPKKWEQHLLPTEFFLEEYLAVQETLSKYGFTNYEISNYAKHSFECKHNKAYWNHSEIVAFGLGAHGYENGVRYSYAENFKDYYAGDNFSEEKLTPESIRIEKIMFGLRSGGFDENLIQTEQKEKLKLYLTEGFLVKKGSLITLGNKGVCVMDSILADII